MILKIGNREKTDSGLFLNKRAYTFIEIMVTLTILSAGLTMIYKTLIASLDRMNYLTNRLYADNLIDNRIAVIERMLRSYKALPFEVAQKEAVNIGRKELEFKQETLITEVENFLDVFQLDLTVGWQERDHQVSLKRSAYIADFESPPD